ncbi:hypothetical protein ADU59_08925 [Pararhizobium polonicum]|uniref:Uncharacterized protein n=1 Tax=Pararhizobium polonicum TaxID=1612624 RepID=A0A1C7P2P4_9HYPH|nr:hypothetical protein [Pararhizobium polonicum]OBZ95528.1 hypothetical protein ADU59_08925 [Pararhizobium polonicum]
MYVWFIFDGNGLQATDQFGNSAGDDELVETKGYHLSYFPVWGTRATGNQMKTFRYFDLAAIVVFAVAGPLIAELAFIAWLIVLDPSELLHLANIGRAFVNFVSILPIFYLLGLVPSLLAGLLFGIVWKMWPGRMLHGALVCASAGSGAGALAALLWAIMLRFPDYTSGSLYYGLGACSGAVCALLVRYCKIVAREALATPAP